ncbi:MAG: hypothetical protein ACTHMJ_13830 [Thermomicrobiales bacterium]
MPRRLRQFILVLALLISLVPGVGRAAVSAGGPANAHSAASTQTRGLVGPDTTLGIVANAVSRAQSAPDAPLYAELLAGGGAHWVREEFRWDLIEPAPGQWTWRDHDDAVAAYHDYGLDVIGLLDYSVGWAVAGAPSSPLPPPRDAWAAFVTATVTRYHDTVHVWEVWNEPDLATYWGGDARSYAALLDYTAVLIHQLDPSATVISGGVSEIDRGIRFLDTVRELGGLDHVDGVGIHPYLLYHSLLYGAYRNQDVPALRAFQDRADRPLWLTEFGFSSLLEGGGAPGESAQATGLVRQIVETVASPLDVRAMVVYDAADDGTSSAYHDQFLGLLRHDGRTPKAAYTALKTVGQQLAGLAPVGVMPTDDPLITLYRFDHGDGSVTDVVWTDGEQRTLALNTAGPLRVTSIVGAQETRPSTLGQVVLAVGAEPLYLTYRPTANGVRYIAESGHTLSGAFLDAWLTGGGLDSLGLPLSEPMNRGGVWVQYFERGRLEFDGAMRWGLTGRETAARYPAAPRVRVSCVPACPTDSPTFHYFPETGHTLANGMLAFWQGHGGLQRFGYPLSEEFTSGPLVLQIFERARLEYHPDSGLVTIARTGAEVMESQRADWPFWATSPYSSDPGRVYLPPTGHALTAHAAAAWLQYGGVALLGYPLSEEFVENGLVVQVFERGKLVWSPQGEPSLALVGADYARRQHDPATLAALALHDCRTAPAPPEASSGPVADDTRPACLADAAYFPETQHTLRGAFATFWTQHGGLAQFGYPLSEEFVSQGQVVQYFERARFELGPNGEVRLTRVGADLYGR